MKTADQRIVTALQRIERAQNDLDDACSDISRVIGLVDEWEAIGAESTRVKALWHRLNNMASPAGGWKLDG